MNLCQCQVIHQTLSSLLVLEGSGSQPSELAQTMAKNILAHVGNRDLDATRQNYPVLVAQWQSTGSKSQVSWVQFSATDSIATFLYFAS